MIIMEYMLITFNYSKSKHKPFFFLLVLLIMLTSCGNKGPLFLPNEQEQQKTAIKANKKNLS